MTPILIEELNPLIQSEWDFLESKNGEWSLLQGEQDMEVLEHVLRCILHMDLTDQKPREFQKCVKVQNPDGGNQHISRASLKYLYKIAIFLFIVIATYLNFRVFLLIYQEVTP
jgi:hypothetical protein